jgi:hypothetical protein
MQNPSSGHLNTGKRVLAWLSGARNHGLRYTQGGQFIEGLVLVGWVDKLKPTHISHRDIHWHQLGTWWHISSNRDLVPSPFYATTTPFEWGTHCLGMLSRTKNIMQFLWGRDLCDGRGMQDDLQNASPSCLISDSLQTSLMAYHSSTTTKERVTGALAARCPISFATWTLFFVDHRSRRPELRSRQHHARPRSLKHVIHEGT